MDSDIDMFNSEPLIDEANNIEESRSISCPVKMAVVYGYVILFNWKEGVKKPFKMYTRNSLKEIMEYTINNHLKEEFRVKCLKPLRSLPGEKLSLFARVEDGELFFCFIIFLLFAGIYIPEISKPEEPFQFSDGSSFFLKL